MDKLELLRQNLSQYARLCVCFSGGVDSTLLLRVAHDALGDNAFAILADTVFIPRREVEEATALARTIGAECRVLILNALGPEQVRYNDKRRCYYCKRNIFTAIQAKALELGATAVADGQNCDDALVYRPGSQAASELGVVSPLAEAGLTKADIRRYSQELGLPTWNKPAYACLASRLPYDTEVTPQALGMIEQAEILLHDRGFLNVRARLHGDLLRVEAPPVDFAGILNADIIAGLKNIGFRYVTLDMEGFRSGSMDS